MQANPMASVVCFAGLGPGEVLCGEKAVGISQRRVRTAARFQSVALLGWDWSLQQRLLRPGLERVGDPHQEPRVSPLGDVGGDELLDAFIFELERS
jgi:hypothetical protein